MSNSHEGVSCDNCMKSNFSGKRYKCLICYDFDLCSTCYDQSQAQIESSNTSSSSSTSSIQDGGGCSATKSTRKSLSKSNKLRTSEPATTVISNSIQINQNSHLNAHAMQCILTRNDHDLFYGGTSGNEQQSFTCPYCAKCGFSETTLSKHLSSTHSSLASQIPQANTTTTTAITNQPIIKKEVVCPICAVLPSSNGGDPNHLTDNLLNHINSEHTASNKNSEKNLDDTLNDIGIGSMNSNNSSNANSAAAAAALRFSRRLNYSQNASRSSLASQSGITIGNSSNRANGGSISRYAFQFGQNNSGIGGLSSANALSSFMRSTSGGTGLDNLSSSLSNQMDPIAELLSQLTGVRRATFTSNSTNSQLQQLQAQLSRERESLQQPSGGGGSAVILAATGSGTGSSRNQHLHHHLFSGGGSGGLGANLSKSQLLNSLASSKSNNQNQNNQNAANQALQTANNITNAFASQVLELPPNYLFTQSATLRDPRYLLSKYDFTNGENQPPNTNINQINQSIFINDILISILTEQLENEQHSPDNKSEASSQQNSDRSGFKQNAPKQTPLTEEEKLAEDLLKSCLQAAAANDEICMKNKVNPIGTDEAKLMEL